MLVFCFTNPDNLDRNKRYSFFIIETDRPRFEVSKLKGKLGIKPCDTAELYLNNVRVPDNLIVDKEREGFKQLMY